MPLAIRPYITPTGIITIRYNIISSGNIVLRSYFSQDQLLLSRDLIPLYVLQRLVLFFFLNRSYYLEIYSIYISNYFVSTSHYLINPQLLVRKILIANSSNLFNSSQKNNLLYNKQRKRSIFENIERNEQISKASYSGGSTGINRNNGGTSNGGSLDIVITNPIIVEQITALKVEKQRLIKSYRLREIQRKVALLRE